MPRLEHSPPEPHASAAVAQRGLGALRWPLPAVLAWLTGWLSWRLALTADVPTVLAFATALLLSGGLAWSCGDSTWRRTIAASGFPLSALALGAAAAMPAWVWLLLLLPLLAVYPLRAWRDAPFFPTPPDALDGVEAIVGQPQSVLDAGCGLGHGLQALRRVWPQARLQGLEWSVLLSLLARWRCRSVDARVRRGDMWASDWSGHDLVYVFQRPESMARAYAKAQRELAPTAWLVSLEFEVPGRAPWASLQGPGRRPLWIYRPAQALPVAPAPAAASTAGAVCR